MKQSRFMSMLETAMSTAAGFFLSLFLQWLILPVLIGVNISLETNLAFAAIMTIASLVRGFVMRRLFETLHIRRPLSPFMHAVIAECFRQPDQEGYDQAHDDGHGRGELAQAGAAYLLHAGSTSRTVPHEWPWANGWNPKDYRRNLVRGVALGIAEGNRFDRERKVGRGR